MPIIALEGNEFFRQLVKGHGRSNPDNFKSLNNLTVSAGGYTYRLILMVGLTASLIALVLAGFALAVARNSRGYDETKKRITRVVIILWMLTALVAIVGFIANVFTWY